jgi:hypothetical protein
MTIDGRHLPSDPSDLDLRQTSPDAVLPTEPASSTHRGLWIAIALLVVAAGAAVYVVFGTRRTAPAPAATSEARPNAPPLPQLGSQADSITLPPLDQSDAVVRELVSKLSANPSVASWLATDGLIRNFTVVVANTAEGTSPTVHLRRLRPAAPFAVIKSGAGLAIDPASYRRYDGIAAAAASLDPAGASRLYATLKPRIEDAYRDLNPDARFDETLERAIVALLRTPVVRDPILVEPQGGVGYAFVDPALERLSPPQKQLLRTGPENVQRIQTALRTIAEALGIPKERLPASR